MENNTDQKFTKGLHHLGLTVPDVAITAAFFVDQLGFMIVGEKPDYPAIFVSDGTIMLTLWQAQCETPNPFDRKNVVGLHHFALKVESKAKLDELYQTFSTLPEIAVEFAPEALGGSGAVHMMCTIPGGLRVEFIVTP
ncbi:glyoxalase/bleomycin resistance protein/dioxygenase [Oleiphilus messinensis]|uniref:Glyoxalase/bleomycin resistance protein/dioxygenase n=1 Tax=Oleiphilus messinensis TaxID=141451 RepID=A0A1Y0IDW5_9GAMM|nr:VOC family protein [Oleiphilus messinensis]ARU58460.1 glyoxalase/bleomycin resistance protein/dioxygenase [Oleiphilus messinensis]